MHFSRITEEMREVKTILLMILLNQLNHQSLGIKYSEDWSKKFVSVRELRLRKLHPMPTFYDPNWAWRVMNEARRAVPRGINSKILISK